MRVHWKPSLRASALNLGRQIVLNTAAVAESSDASLQSLAQTIYQACHALDAADPLDVWCRLIAAVDSENSGLNLANDAASSLEQGRENGFLGGWLERGAAAISESEQRTLLAALRSMELAFRSLYPQADSQLPYRLGPLMQQWDGYGAGLMAHLKRLTGVNVSAGEVQVLAVHPIVNGDGFAAPHENTAVMEATLVNPIPELPEVIRLGWLIAQVQVAKQTAGLESNGRRHRDVTALALLPAVLAASEVVELSRCDVAMLQLALDQFAPRQPERVDLSEVLMHWWETFLQTKPQWTIGILALDRALNPHET